MTRARVMPFVALEGSTLLAGLANGVAMVALPWLVLELTGRADAAGLVALVAGLPDAVRLALLRDGRRHHRTPTHLGDQRPAVGGRRSPRSRSSRFITDLTFAWVLVLAVLGAVFDPAGRHRPRVDADRRLAGHRHAAGARQRHPRGGLGTGLPGRPSSRRRHHRHRRRRVGVLGDGGRLHRVGRAARPSSTCPAPDAPQYEHQPYFWAGTWDGIRLVFTDAPLRAVVLLSTGVVAHRLPGARHRASGALPGQRRPGRARRGRHGLQPRRGHRCPALRLGRSPRPPTRHLRASASGESRSAWSSSPSGRRPA